MIPFLNASIEGEKVNVQCIHHVWTDYIQCIQTENLNFLQNSMQLFKTH